jgi:hypothetical protein
MAAVHLIAVSKEEVRGVGNAKQMLGASGVMLGASLRGLHQIYTHISMWSAESAKYVIVQRSSYSLSTRPRSPDNQDGHALMLTIHPRPPESKICLPLPLKIWLTTASATACGSMTPKPERPSAELYGAVMGVAAHAGCTQVSLISGTDEPYLPVRSSDDSPS